MLHSLNCGRTLYIATNNDNINVNMTCNNIIVYHYVIVYRIVANNAQIGRRLLIFPLFSPEIL